nr:hypothetical protein [Tanacetum cinerariifolium]
MDQYSTYMVVASKVPMLKPDEYELWRMRMEQYIQMVDYSLWDVIENGNAPLITQAVEKRFGGNVATKKTQRNLLKQQYENFTASSSEVHRGYNWSDQAKDGPTNFALMAYSSTRSNYEIIDKCKTSLGYNVVPPPYTGNFLPLKPDLSGLEEFVNEFKVSEPTVKKPIVETSKAKASIDKPKVERKNFSPPLIEDWISDGEDEAESKPKIEKKTVKPSFAKIAFIKSKKQVKSLRKTTVKQDMLPLEVTLKEGKSQADVQSKLFWEMKCIMRQYSVARTSQQNRVAEKRNRTLIEAIRTMLADSKLPTTFWAEAVNTACYVQNRVLAVKPYNKTPYELFHGRTPALSFMRPFGCPLIILNTKDHLGKFAGKADEGFFVGYPLNSKAFRVFNNRTRTVEENFHIRFSENTPNIVGRNKSNDNVGTKVCDDASKARMETIPDKDYILLALWTADPLISQESKNQDKQDNVNITNNVNAAGTNKVNVVGANISNELPFDPEMTALEDINTFNFLSDHEDDDEETDMNNMDTTIQVSPTPSTRIHKDHPLDQRYCDKKQTRLVDQGHIQEEGIDYDNKISLVAKIEAIRLFLAYASFKDFVVYQMDVKSAFLYEKIEEEKKNGIFISQDKYIAEILKKYGFLEVKNAITPMKTQKPLLKDVDGEEVDVHMYRSMIGSLMYLTSSRPDIMFAVCACARHQVNLKVSHLHAVKRTFKYLKCQPKFGLWYPKDSPIDLVAYTGSDYAGASLDRKSTTGEAEYVVASSCCRQATVKAKTVNGERQLQALVDGKKMIITESTIRRDLQLEDVEVLIVYLMLSSLNNLHLWDDVVNEEMDGSLKRAATTATSLDADQDKGNIFKTQSKETPNEPGSQGASSGGGLRCQEAIGDTAAQTKSERLQQRVLDLETTNTTQAMEIESLKRRVKKLEKKKRSRTHGLKRLYKVGLSARVESFEDEGLEVSVVDEVNVVSTATTTTATINDITLAKALMEIKSAKPKTTTASSRPKAKGIVIHNQEQAPTLSVSSQQPSQVNDKGKGKMVEPETIKKLSKKYQLMLDEKFALKLQAKEEEEEERIAKEKVQQIEEVNIAWDDVQAKIDADYELAQRLQAKEQDDLIDTEKAKLFMEFSEKRRKFFAAKIAEEKRNIPPTFKQAIIS